MLKAPFPWFGGKSRVADIVWQRLGDVPNYIEPFFGSGAVLLGRPHEARIETINDLDAYVCNFWRAVQFDPRGVADFVNHPVSESDLHARHVWLKEQHANLRARLEGDPHYFETKVAGWWCWGICCWIAGGWCSTGGPWLVQKDADGFDCFVKRSTHHGRVCRQLPRLSSHMGVNRKLAHIANTGVGVHRITLKGAAQRLFNAGMSPHSLAFGEDKADALLQWMLVLSRRLSRARVCNGDWSRVLGKQTLKAGRPCGVFFDPPYAGEGRDLVYGQDDIAVAHAVHKWCAEHGDDADIRIALCGYDEHDELANAGWSGYAWSTSGGYGNLAGSGNDSRGRRNAARERIWFSPHCVDDVRIDDFFDELVRFPRRHRGDEAIGEIVNDEVVD